MSQRTSDIEGFQIGALRVVREVALVGDPAGLEADVHLVRIVEWEGAEVGGPEGRFADHGLVGVRLARAGGIEAENGVDVEITRQGRQPFLDDGCVVLIEDVSGVPEEEVLQAEDQGRAKGLHCADGITHRSPAGGVTSHLGTAYPSRRTTNPTEIHHQNSSEI